MILVDVSIPSLDETFNFRIDESAKIINIVQEISEMMCKKYKTVLNEKAENFMLCSVEKGEILDGYSTLEENKIKNGSHLYMV